MLIFEDNVGSFPCATRVVFDSHCHSFAGMDDGARRPYGALFWTENGLPVARGLPDSDDEKIEDLCSTCSVPIFEYKNIHGRTIRFYKNTI